MDEKAVSAIHLCPYLFFFFHLRKSFVCCLTSLFLIMLFLDKITEFLFTLIIGSIFFFSFKNPKLSLESYAPSPKRDLIFFLLGLIFKTFSTSFFIILLSCTFSSVTSNARISLVFISTTTCILIYPFFPEPHLSDIH